MLVDFTQSF